MSPEEREELEQQAGEYALGTLTGDDRLRFEQVLAHEPWLQRLVDEWSRRLGPLAETLTPVAPPPELWQRIEARLSPAPSVQPLPTPTLWERLAFWRWTAFGAAAAAALLLLYVVLGPRVVPAGDYVAVLNDAQARPAVLVVADLEARTLTIRQIAPTPAGKAHELWLLPPASGTAPRSLGVITGGTARSNLSADLADALPSATLAVSLEPPSGSPTGQPTGPVLFTGPVLPLQH